MACDVRRIALTVRERLVFLAELFSRLPERAFVFERARLERFAF